MSQFSAKLHQSQQMKQEMKINPRLYQAMELLYMPLLDLQQHLKQEMAENPFLEMSEADVQQEVELKEEEKEAKEEEEEIDWEEILLDGFDAGGRKAQYEHKEYYQPTPVATSDLRDHLDDQLRLLDLSERERRLGEEIIGNVDDDGSLSCSLEEVVEGINDYLDELDETARENAEEIADPEERAVELAEIEELFRPYTIDEAESMLTRIQFFDPPGVAARDLRECILIQMRHHEMEGSLAHEIVREHFDDLINHRWSDIAKSMGINAREVQDAADEISTLDPKPGLKYTPDPEQYVIPDLIVDVIDGEYMVFVNDTSLPRLRLSRAYREVARDKKKFKGENKEFISSKLNSANWMIQAIEQRRQTMLKVMHFIVDRQRDFFEKGVQHLKPLTLREVAEHIDMHESTVSRVTNEKFCQTPRGVYSLKFFFSSGLSTTSGEDISARGVKDKIKILVDEEDTQKPLTDQAIVNLLKQDGVKIARRTVAKYRDQLGILPARMRKRV
ncbi:MAG: RNA polymerase factor sigma-54 [Gemmatimonadetes bacterium]|nr:RNA polymerase factor sigma-54 [Gemmatimonadota bacterium]